ncbi:acyltransferase [Acinetobacter qingfengensis]|uniref:Acyltransferase n=1 Tax=Acinetobacter qingfengensis TaxID=1262585 RepID=A0A1E7QYQ2_9GAMM|nr:acyltransferase [Acinetobacter qingfengensis]KAA8731401.1 acyltransferase [Acinetobacter qingfengensis]OEY92194.1 acyltransferase [Acinetobacter qingfengensis]
MPEHDPLLKYREQHQHRLNYMPWLYWKLKPRNKLWAQAWQQDYQQYLQEMEDIEIGENCFISPLAHLFAEPGRKIIIGDHSFVAADSVLHGPLHIGNEVAINHHCTLDGGRAGITLSDQVRLAAYTHIYAFNHGMKTNMAIYEQPVRSKGVFIGKDVWIGADVGIVDGVHIDDYAVIGMNAVVTRNVESYAIMAGNPAQKIADRRNKK